MIVFHIHFYFKQISDGCNLNYETWSDLVRSRSRGNTNADQARTRSATGASSSSGGNYLIGLYLLIFRIYSNRIYSIITCSRITRSNGINCMCSNKSNFINPIVKYLYDVY